MPCMRFWLSVSTLYSCATPHMCLTAIDSLVMHGTPSLAPDATHRAAAAAAWHTRWHFWARRRESVCTCTVETRVGVSVYLYS